MKKQIISLGMAIIMVLSMLPMSAFAGEEPDVPAELPAVTAPLPPDNAPDETTPPAEEGTGLAEKTEVGARSIADDETGEEESQ